MNVNFLSGADNVLLNIGNNQQNLTKLVSELSSGLRIQSAADDPSGNAIAQKLQTKVNGLQQSVENVQEGNNLLTVADGAAATIQSILERINSLIIESDSDINSDTQLQAIQDEINQNLLEINRVATNANFNGVTLFDGSHDTYVAPKNANVSFVAINPGLLPDGSIPTGDTVSNPDGGSATLITAPTNGETIEQAAEPFVDGIMILQVTQSGTNLVDPTSGVVPGEGVELNQILYSDSPQFGAGEGNESILYNIIANDLGPNAGGGTNFPVNEFIPDSGQVIQFNLANLTTADVGVAMGVAIVGPQASGGGVALNINDGGDEGTTIAISLPTLNTGALNISDISVLRPTQLDDQFGTGAPTGVDQSNQYAAMNAQFFVSQALQTVAETRAQLGAQMVATNEDANDDQVGIINYTASESSIADLNIGTATTQFTKDQILAQVGTSVLAQMQVSAKTLSDLMLGALSGGGLNTLA